MIFLGILIGLLVAVIGVLLYDKFKPIQVSGLTKEQEKKAREQNEHYNNMLNYNASQAYGGSHG
jgi:hypothetical protein